MLRITLPSIHARSRLVQPRDVANGNLAHCRFKFAGKEPEYFLVDREVAGIWMRKGLDYAPGSVRYEQYSFAEPREGLVSVSITYGNRETKSFLVAPMLAEEWLQVARDLTRLRADYDRIIKGV